MIEGADADAAAHSSTALLSCVTHARVRWMSWCTLEHHSGALNRNDVFNERNSSASRSHIVRPHNSQHNVCVLLVHLKYLQRINAT
jgi:hypothetical protein